MTTIRKIAVIGSGTMGGGIAISAVSASVPVILIDSSAEILDQACARTQKYLARQVEKGRLDPSNADDLFALLTTSTSLEDASGVDLVIEAVFEDLDVKRDVFTELERMVSESCIFATNTSALKVSDISNALRQPQRMCGTHYFSPAEVNPVVEVISTDATTPETIAAVLQFLSQCRKTPIRCKDQTGFALNRFFCPYTNEATKCLDDGLGTPAQIDRVARILFGVPIGPFAVMNIVKPRINLAAIRSLTTLGPFYAPSRSMVQCGDADDSWDIVDSDMALDDSSQQTIAERLSGAVFRAVREALDEGIATADDIDLGARKAFAFAKGPNAMMEEIGTVETQRLIGLVAG